LAEVGDFDNAMEAQERALVYLNDIAPGDTEGFKKRLEYYSDPQ
jgi:hypothetical protein